MIIVNSREKGRIFDGLNAINKGICTEIAMKEFNKSKWDE